MDNICNLVEIFYSQDFIKKKKSSYTLLWFWFVKYGWSFSNNLYIKKEIMNNFVIKIIIDEFIMWSIIVEHDFDGRYYIRFVFFFFVLYICMLYTQLYKLRRL